MGFAKKRFARIRSTLLAALFGVALGSVAFAPAPGPEIAFGHAPQAALHSELVTLAVLSDSAFHPRPLARTLHRDLYGVLPATSPRLPSIGSRTLETRPGIALGPSPSFTPNARAPPRAG